MMDLVDRKTIIEKVADKLRKDKANVETKLNLDGGTKHRKRTINPTSKHLRMLRRIRFEGAGEVQEKPVPARVERRRRPTANR